MLLADHDLRTEIEQGNLQLHPYDPALIQPASIDVRLFSIFRAFNTANASHIDPAVRHDEMTRLISIPRGYPFVLHPGEFVLACTVETVSLGPGLAARLEGKSSLGRLGLMTHATAGFIDPGFTGQVTLELKNVAPLPIKLWPGMAIGQLCVFRMSSPVDIPYGTEATGSRYQGQKGPTVSRSWQNWKTWQF